MLEVNKIDKIDAGLFKVRLQKNPPSINIVSEKAIPNTYRVPQPDKIDTKGLLAAVKQGVVIDGVELVTDKKAFAY